MEKETNCIVIAFLLRLCENAEKASRAMTENKKCMLRMWYTCPKQGIVSADSRCSAKAVLQNQFGYN